MSGGIANVKMVLLWADEIRAAAAAIRRANDLPDDATDAEFGEAAREALKACIIALDGADDEHATLLLGTKPTPKA